MNRRPLATTFAGLMVAYGDLGKRPSRPDVWMSVRTDRFGTALRNGDSSRLYSNSRAMLLRTSQHCLPRRNRKCWGTMLVPNWRPLDRFAAMLRAWRDARGMSRPSWRALCTFIATWWPRSSGAVAGQAMILSSASSGRWRPMVTCRDCGQRWESEPARHLLFAAHERLTRRLESHGVGAQRTPGRFPSPYEPP